MKYTIRLAVAALTFMIGMTAPYVARYYYYESYPQNTVEPINSAPPSLLKDAGLPNLTFAKTGIMSVMTVDHGCFEVYVYKSSDGQEVRMRKERFESPSAAIADLHTPLGKTESVIEQTDVQDERGVKVGERRHTVSNFQQTQYTDVKWTHDAELIVVWGESERHVLAFEKLLLAGKITDLPKSKLNP